MKLVIVVVRDRSADVFAQPMFVANRGSAIRSFADQVNDSRDEKNILNRHPEDFDLFELGTYDDSTGLFESGVPKQIAVGKDLVRG